TQWRGGKSSGRAGEGVLPRNPQAPSSGPSGHLLPKGRRATTTQLILVMLGRSANDLFWMSRYMERAENIARLLEVGYRIALLPHEGAGQDDEWRSTLRSAGCEKGYLAKYGAYGT